MAEVYVTLGEAAELERVKYNTMVKRVLRKQESFVTKTEKSENGGKDVVLVAVSSLSKQARNAWKEREKLKSFTEEFPDKKEDEQKPEVPWYVNTDVDWYIENYKERYYKAVELGNVVRKFLQYDEGDRTKYAEEFAQKYLGKGQRTLYRYTKAYLEASAWADKLEKEDGAGREFFKVLCLCRKPKETGCFPSIKPEVKQVIKNIWFNEDFARNQGTREMLYEKLTAIANINKWEKIPSYQTVTRYISYLMEDEGMRNAWFLASRGTREYKNKVMVKGSRDTKGLQVMQIVMGDEHAFDCWVSYKQPNGKVIAIKPHLAAWVDMRSRVIMGDVMCKDANSDILKQSLLKMIYSEPGGVPEYLYIDNGKDYTAKTMTGRDRNDRSGMNFDNETMGFYKSIGIKDDHRALPYEPWSKGQIERFFRTVCNKFTRWMKSYTGTLTGSKTSDKVDKDIKRMLERGELLTLEEFYEKWHEWLTTVYMHTEHSGLKKMGETYKKTSGSEMASAISALGATATNANVPLEEQLAIMGQLQTTMSGSEAATKYKSFLNQASSAGEKLGLTFLDTNNQLLSMPDILTELKSKYGETIDAVEKRELKEAFGTDEAVALIDLLYNNVETLDSGIQDLQGSMKNGISVTEEMAEAINNTPEQKFQVLKQQIHNNVEELGNGLLPAVNNTMDKVSGLIQKGSKWISNNQETVQSIMNIALKLGVFLVIAGSVMGVIGSLGKLFLSCEVQ